MAAEYPEWPDNSNDEAPEEPLLTDASAFTSGELDQLLQVRFRHAERLWAEEAVQRRLNFLKYLVERGLLNDDI